MCLILFAVNPNDQYQLVVGANRDELYARPTTSARYWRDSPHILAGRDDKMGGTWLGVNTQGRFAAVTNCREDLDNPPPLSRGELTTDFLNSETPSLAYLDEIAKKADQYRGFNLIIADETGCFYYGNRTQEDPKQLPSGYYGLSNQLLNCDWPKVIDGRARLCKIIETESDNIPEGLFSILTSRGDDREFSNSFISSNIYGTRAATVVVIDKDQQIQFCERTFLEQGIPGPESNYAITIKSNADS